MPRLARLTILLAVAVLALSMASPGWAKGGSYLHFDRLYYAPGETVQLQTQFRTDVVGWRTGSVKDGPYYAYLLPRPRQRIPYIDPPHIPKAAVLLGPILIERGKREGVWSASISFVMPHVQPGEYWMDICNDPCRHSSVGDLETTSLQLAATAEEARLLNQVHEWVTDLIDDRVPPVEVEHGDLIALRVSEALRDTRTRLDIARELRELRDEVVSLRAQSQVEDSATGLGSGLWLAGWLVAAGTAALWWASWWRRRSAERVRARPAAV